MTANQPPTATLAVFRAASLFTLLAVVLGSVVCATESGFECGNWPGCTDNALLPSGGVNEWLYRNPWIEMVHRTSAILAGPFALASGVLALRLKAVHPLVKVLPWVTVLGAIVAGYVGRGIVLGVAFPAWVGAADLGSALVAMAAMLTATVALERTPASWFASTPGMLAWGASATLLVMHLASLYAAGAGSYTRCMSWPVWELLTADTTGSLTLQYLRMVLAVLAGGLIVAALVVARREHLLPHESVAVGVLLGLVVATGLVIRVTGTDALGVPYSVVTVGLLFALVLFGARASLERVPERADAAQQENARA